MCNIENQSEFYKIHPIGGMLTRDQRTIVTFEYKKNYNYNKNCDNVSEKPGYSDECFCETNNYKKKVNSNYNKSQVLTQKLKCDRFSNSFITKKRHTGYRNLSQFKLKYCKSLTLYCLLLLIQITFARPTFFSPNSPYYRHIRAPLKMSSEDHPDYARILEECNTPNMDQQKIDLSRIKKMLESTINTSNIALQEANISGNAFVDVYDPGNGKLEDYHRIWKNKKPEEYNLTWLFPNNKRLPKNYTEPLPTEYQDHLSSGDIHSNATKLLLDSYVRLQHLAHGLDHVLKVINRDGQKNHQEDVLRKLRKIFKEAIDKSQRVLSEVGLFLREISVCNDILTMLKVPETIVEDFEYQEMRNWIIFREYANQLEFNIQAFQILVDRIEEMEMQQ